MLYRLILVSLLFLISHQIIAVDSSDGGKPWKQRSINVAPPTKQPDKLNNYGGLTNTSEIAKGFFRTLKKDHQWWLVDPKGKLFLSIGINSVNHERISSSQTTDKWANATYDLLTTSGFNTLGRWSTPEEFTNNDKAIPWCSSHKFIKTYAQKRPPTNGASGYVNSTLPVFDPEWPEFCKQYAKRKLSNTVDDPFLLGHFSDNELPFRPNALNLYLQLPKSDLGYQAAAKWMKQNKLSDSNDKQAQEKFLYLVASLYFENVAKAIKSVDPNHLYIGSRIHGRCINKPVLQAAKACDIVSINYYHSWQPGKTQTSNWAKWSQRPFLVSEFYAMKVKSKQTQSEWGAGYRVLSHKNAGKFYHTYTKRLLEDIPNCVGWHWFKYADDAEYYQKGIVGVDGTPHKTLLQFMKTLNEQAYSLRINDKETNL